MDTMPDALAEPVEAAAEWAHQQAEQYSDGEERPLGSYLATSAVYLTAVTIAAAVVGRSNRSLPDRFAFRDLALLAVGTYKASRLLSKDTITSPLRAPFTRFAGSGAPAELDEEARGTGARHAIGELVTCPFCMSQWIATAAMFGLVLAPRPTRFVATTLSVVAASDLLQYLYAAAEQASE